MFQKKTYNPLVRIAVTLPTRPGDEYVFAFPKKLPQAALDAEKEFLGFDESERKKTARELLVTTVSRMLVEDPAGFAGYPTEGTVEERALRYFDDPDEPELETILAHAWSQYKEVTRPSAYLKSVEDSGAAPGGAPPAARQA